jgi:hypothetical protein
MKRAIIVDIDGTLVFVGDRSYFDASNAHNVDIPNKPVIELVQMYADAGVQIIFVTGRSVGKDNLAQDSAVMQMKQLFPNIKHGVHAELYMRENNDFRKDTIFKGEVYENQIKGKYEVIFALEDRNQMVDFYRNELKIPCFQVNADTGKKRNITLFNK